MKIVKLKDLTIDGKGTYGIAAPAVDWQENLPTYLRITDIFDDGTLNFSGLKSVSDSNAGKYFLNPNDIVFARTGGSTGRSYFYDGTDGKFVYAGFLIKFSLDSKKVNPKYIKYFCLSESYKKWVHSFNTGSTRGNINAQTFGNLEIPLLERPQQDKIVSFLDSIDQKIKINKKTNDNLEQQASALFKSWFIDFKQVPNCDFVNSEIGLIPNDWRVYKLSDFLPVITGKKNANVSSDKGAYPFFSCSQGISWTNDYSFDGHAILVAGNGDFNVKWYNGKFDAYQRTYVLIPYNKRFTSWLYYAVKYNLFNITSAARGSVIKFITKGNLENFAFAGPKDLDSLDVIDTFTTINHTIDKKTQENYRLSALRDALLPKLMSGEIDVSAVQL